LFETIIGILGLAAAALYVGFLAYKIGAVPLWIIVVGTFIVAIREILIDLRGGRNSSPPK